MYTHVHGAEPPPKNGELLGFEPKLQEVQVFQILHADYKTFPLADYSGIKM